MKSSPLYVMEDYAHNKPWLRAEMPLSQPGALRLVSAHELAEMEAGPFSVEQWKHVTAYIEKAVYNRHSHHGRVPVGSFP